MMTCKLNGHKIFVNRKVSDWLAKKVESTPAIPMDYLEKICDGGISFGSSLKAIDIPDETFEEDPNIMHFD